MADNDSFSLINLEPLSKVAISLLDKLSSAVSWGVTRNTPDRVSVNGFLKDIDESNLDPLEKAVLRKNAKKIIRKEANEEAVVSLAIQNLKDSAKPQNVNSDWLEAFIDKVGLISDKDIQLLWAKVLASECNAPGTVSKSLLFVLERMDKRDAEAFASLCNVAIAIENNPYPLVDADKLDLYSSFGITYDSCAQLETLGLIRQNLQGNVSSKFMVTKEGSDIPTIPVSGSEVKPEKALSVSYFEHTYTLPDKMKSVPVGSVIFTKDGRSLFKVVDRTELECFWEGLVEPWFNKQKEYFNSHNEPYTGPHVLIVD